MTTKADFTEQEPETKLDGRRMAHVTRLNSSSAR